ncbi:MAG: gliding motility-associated C-terminal domain-containing protein [Chitinophagaceae bacterium]
MSKPPCNHFANGSISLTAYNSVAPYTYAIGAGSFSASNTFSGLFSGPYTIHIKNALGCVKDTIVVLPDSVKITASVPFVNILCFGGTNGSIGVNASGAYPPYSYALDAGTFGPSNSFGSLAAGTYVVHVKDTAQCYFDTSITITEPPILTAAATVTANVTCNGGADGAVTVTAGGGTPPYTYNINLTPYFSTNAFTSLPAGTFTLGIKDNNGCVKTTTATVIQPPPIIIAFTFVSPVCSYSANGSITLSATGGTPGYTFAVDASAYSANPTFTGLLGGAHALHIKDTVGCIKDSSIILLAPAKIKPQVALRNSTCNTLGDGTVTMSATGGTPGYTYALNAGSFSANGFFGGLAAGTYTFHVKDTVGCTGDTTITIVDSLKLHANVVLANVVCFNDANGSITIAGIGGQSPYQYAIGAGTFGASGLFSPLANATYIVHVKDSNGCLLDTSLIITQPNLLVPKATVVNASCNGLSDGRVTISAVGGTTPYSYAIGAGTFVGSGLFIGLGAGTDTFYVKDNHGCISDTIITITQPTQISVSVAVTNVVCNAGNSGTATVTATGGTPGYTYSIDTGTYGSSNLFTTLLAGAHTISTKDAHGCIKDTIINIAEPTKLLLGYSFVMPLCNGDYNGSITMSASGGTSPYLYALNSGSFSGTTFYNGLNATTYFLRLKDAHGCKVDSTIALPEPTPLAFSITLKNVACNGDSSGTASIAASGGTPPYQYALDGGIFSSINNFANVPAGLHILHLKDTNNCTKDTQVVISQPTKLRISYTSTQPLCNGDSNATITIVGIGGTTPYRYALNGGAFGSNPNFSGLPTGLYVLHLIDTNSCTRDSVITIAQPVKLSVTANATNVLCHGGSSGTVTITAAGGINPYSYAADAGGFGPSNVLTGLNAGTHIIHTKDQNGCTKDTSITLTEPTKLLIGYTLVSPLCNGDFNGSITITATGGTPGYKYALNASAYGFTGLYSGLGKGIYALHIKDSNNCHVDSNVLLTEPTPLAFTVSLKNVACNGDSSGTASIAASGGTPPYKYALDGGTFSSINSFANIPAGLHILHLQDTNNCTKDTQVVISQPSKLRISYTSTQPLCNGDSNATITIVGIGGTTPYRYALNGGAFGSNPNYSGLPTGTYVLHLIDTNSCTRDSVITIAQPVKLSVTASATNVLCHGGSSGTVTVTAAGGINPYSYAADAGGFGPSNVLTGLNAGTHIIHAKDQNGCTKDTSITITEPTKLLIGYTLVSPLCNGDANGSITITATGGTPGYKYALNASAFGFTTVYSSLIAGNYAIHIKDTNNCRVDSNIILTEPSPLAVSLNVANVLCNGDTSASVGVVGSGGTPGYLYALDAGAFGSTTLYTGLAAGPHSIHLKDTNGCVKDTNFVISQPAKLRLQYSFVNPLCHGDLNGSITIVGIGGTLPYQFAIDAGPLVSSGVFNGLGSGNHTLHLKDAHGCTRDSLINLSEPPALALTVAVTNVLCKGGNSGTATVTASGGIPAYAYAIDAGAYSGSNLFTTLLAGAHTIHLKDVNNCVKDTTITITEPDSLKMNLTVVNPGCNGAATGSITVAGVGGTSPYSYSLNASPYTGTTVYSSLSFGGYVIHIKDANGCKRDSNVNLVQPAPLTFTLVVRNVLCFGDTTGRVTVTATGGTTPYTYAANSLPFDTFKVLTGFPSGVDTIHLKDANGCTKDSIITVTQPTKLTLTYVAVSPLCHGDANGSLTLTGHGGSIPYQYALNGAGYASSGAFNNIIAGNYALHLRDTNGCLVDSNIILTEPQALSFALNITNVLCHGDTTGSVTVVAIGGTPPFQYAKDAGVFGVGSTLTGFGVGVHTIHLKDANGCTKDSTITITEPDSLKMTFSATMPLCNAGSDGTATITGIGGTTPYTYAVDGSVFQAGATLNGLYAGVHILHISDAHGCTKDSTFTLNEPTPISVSAAVKRARCTPLVNGYVWLFPTGGTPGYTYAYAGNPYQLSNQFNNLASGIYTFHVKDSNGCVKDTVIAVFDSVFVHATYTQTNVSCYGGADGTVTIVPSGGDLPYTYAVNANPYATTNPMTGLAAAAYTLHVKDANGCILDTPLNITQPQPIVPILQFNQPLCNGGNDGSIIVGVNGGTPNYTFAMGTGGYSTSNTFTNLKAGTYTFHIKDSKGCQKDTTVTLTEPTRIVIDSVIVTQVKCHGDNSGTATLYAHDGTPPYTYAKDSDPYSGSNLVTGFNAGTHVVHVKDANGCIRDSSILLTEPAALSFTVPGINQPTCEGFKDGSITIAARGGVSPYTYQMPPNPYKNVSFYTGLSEGSYTVRVMDSNNCVYDTIITLIGNPHLVIESVDVQSPSCFGLKNGVVTLTVSGGVPPLSYHGSGIGLTNNTGIFDTLKKGVYTFTVTDSKGCKKDTLLTITEPPLLSIGSTATPNDCEGPDNGGKVTTVTSGGTEPYSYFWSDTEVTSDIAGVTNGAYWVTVTDAHNCKDSSLSVVGYDNCCKPYIPDAFTPNGDGKNDVFRVRWKGDISKMVFSIYNRYGTRVFVSYQPDFSWNGKYEGKLCDMGVYFYTVKFICGSKGDNEVSFKGDVTLIR